MFSVYKAACGLSVREQGAAGLRTALRLARRSACARCMIMRPAALQDPFAGWAGVLDACKELWLDMREQRVRAQNRDPWPARV